jgi:hypothetical protein
MNRRVITSLLTMTVMMGVLSSCATGVKTNQTNSKISTTKSNSSTQESSSAASDISIVSSSVVGTSSSPQTTSSSKKSSSTTGSLKTSSTTSTLSTTSASTKLVGVTYVAWFPPMTWAQTWGTPILGQYKSNDPKIIKQQIQMIENAGVDFVWLDMTNDMDHIKGNTSTPWDIDIESIEQANDVFFQVLAETHSKLKVILALGNNTDAAGFLDGRMKRKCDQIYNDYINNPKYKDYYLQYQGKPLVPIMAGVPAFYQRGLPPYKDDRFTIKYFSGFLGQQPSLIDATTRVSKFGYWSWWERGNNTFALNSQGKAEEVTIAPAWKGENGGWADPNAVGRKNGQTFIDQWKYAISKNPDMIVIQSFSQWSSASGSGGNDGENLNAEFSTDIEPSVELGYKYMDITREYSAIFKAKK